jgi:hypothetical protein
MNGCKFGGTAIHLFFFVAQKKKRCLGWCYVFLIST